LKLVLGGIHGLQALAGGLAQRGVHEVTV
jgi:hypothetical protein